MVFLPLYLSEQWLGSDPQSIITAPSLGDVRGYQSMQKDIEIIRGSGAGL